MTIRLFKWRKENYKEEGWWLFLSIVFCPFAIIFLLLSNPRIIFKIAFGIFLCCFTVYAVQTIIVLRANGLLMPIMALCISIISVGVIFTIILSCCFLLLISGMIGDIILIFMCFAILAGIFS